MDSKQAIKEFEKAHAAAIARRGSNTYPQIIEYHYEGFERGLQWVAYTVDNGRGDIATRAAGY